VYTGAPLLAGPLSLEAGPRRQRKSLVGLSLLVPLTGLNRFNALMMRMTKMTRSSAAQDSLN
jgi:hypothetical protein